MKSKQNVLSGFWLGIIAVGIISFNACDSIGQQNPVEILSPNEKTEIKVALNLDGQPAYSVNYNGKEILSESTLGIEFRKAGLLSSGLDIEGVQRSSRNETYNIVAGKSDSAQNHYNEAAIIFKEKKSPGRRLGITFRAFDDGIALRYTIPQQSDISSFKIISEKTTFRFPGNHKVWAASYGSYNTNQESEFNETVLDSIGKEDIIGLPLTIQQRNGTTLAITEANLKNYAGMYLGAADSSYTLRTKLAPLPDSSGVLVEGKPPFKTPWRVIMIGEDSGELITSNIITSLNEPSKIEDTSWIEPGKVIFPWWPDFKTDDPATSGKLNYENQKYYIDFASAHNIKYLEMEPPWYGPERDVIDNPLDYDITKPIPELNFSELIEYAKKRDVRFIIWMHWEALEKQMDEALATYENWGAAGIKVDFMNRDDQEMVDFYHKVAEKAARHNLVVYYHGAYKPTGLRRTWPNVLTREGVLGLEYNKWSERITPEHNVTLPFTRMLAGPMDYTPGGFNNVTKNQFSANYSEPMVMGTRAHQLAMFVVYESPLQMVADYPGAIENQPGSDFIKTVPASWDETYYLEGEIGNYVAIARRKGDRWFLGAMTDWTPREVELPLTFLSSGKYEAVIYEDGENAAKEPKQIHISTKEVDAADSLKVSLAPGGGNAIYFKPIDK